MTIKAGDILPKAISEIKNAGDTKPKFTLGGPTLVYLFNDKCNNEYLSTLENKEIVRTIFSYFLGHDNFNRYNLIKSEPSLDKGLLIFGDYGVGKSLLFDTLQKVGADLMKELNDPILWFRSISAGSFVDNYMSEVTKKEKNAFTNFDLRDYYKGKLYIDDLGFEKKAFNRDEIFADILFERNRLKSKTFVTTNLTPSEISERYGERIGDRLPEMFNIIKWNGTSFRK